MVKPARGGEDVEQQTADRVVAFRGAGPKPVRGDGPARRMQSWLPDLTAEVGEARWSPRRTLAFVVVAGGAAWALIIAAIWFVFFRR